MANWIDRRTNEAIGKSENAQTTTPVLGTMAKETAQGTGGVAQVVGGVFRGNKGQIKRGAKNVYEGFMSTATGGALRSLNEPPPRVEVAGSTYGGSPERAAELQNRNAVGMQTGQAVLGSGLNTLSTAAQQAAANRDAAIAMGEQGNRVAMRGMGGQDAALAAQLKAATDPVGSYAEAQQNLATQQQAQEMQAQAVSARGGNQAAAMRIAQAQASQNALVNNAQIGLMRLQEEQQRRQNVIGANQFAASAMGDRAQLGYGVQQNAAGLAGAATGQTANIGQAVGGFGVQTTGQYLGADTTQNTAQLSADTARAEAQARADAAWNEAATKAKGGVAGVVGKVVGGLFGG